MGCSGTKEKGNEKVVINAVCLVGGPGSGKVNKNK
jgi:hypothetical protein